MSASKAQHEFSENTCPWGMAGYSCRNANRKILPLAKFERLRYNQSCGFLCYREREMAVIKISACVITKNEEKNILRWLDCVKKIADEIIVVDTGSEDRTVELARENGAATHYFKWCNDFSAAKNHALKKATGDWILFLDADEYFAEPEKVRPFLESVHGNRNIIGIGSPLYNIDTDRNNEIITTAVQNRLFRNDKHLRYQGKIHESIVYSGKKSVRFAMSDLSIYHSGYSISLTRTKNLRNLELLLKDVQAEGGEQPKHYPYLSVTYFNLHQFDKAIHYAKLAIKSRAEETENAFVKQYWIWIKAERLRHAPTAALQEIIDAALIDLPDCPDFLWEDAKLALQRRDFLTAQQKLMRILEKAEDKDFMRRYESTIHNQLAIVHAALGKLLDTQGKSEEAIRCYKNSLKENPYAENVLRDLLHLLAGQNPKETIRWLDQVYVLDRDAPFLEKCLERRPLDEIYLHCVRPEQDSYEALMGQRAYRAAAGHAGRTLSYLRSNGNPMDRYAVDLAGAIGRNLVIALLSMSKEDFSKCSGETSLLPLGMQACLERFHNGSPKLSAESADAYYALLDEILPYSSPDVIDRFGLLSQDLDGEDILQTAVRLFDQGRWMTVLELYRHVPDELRASLPGFWYYSGICHFYCGEKKEALHHLEKAAELGMKAPDLQSYITWCS